MADTSPALRARELARFRRAYEDGSLLALFEAIGFVLSNEPGADAHDVPTWILAGCSEWVGRWLVPHRSKRGRTANPEAAMQADLVHVTRWDMVEAIRRYQAEDAVLREDLRILVKQGRMTRGEMTRTLRGRRDFGRFVEDAYDAASKALEHSIAFGTPGAIKKSYLLVKRRRTALVPQHTTAERLEDLRRRIK